MSDARLKRDLNRLVEPPRPARALPEAVGVAPIAAAVGAAKPVIRSSAAPSTGGIAGPLIESDYSTRTWHLGALTTASTDGTLTLLWDLPASIDMEDGNATPFQIVLDAP